jgi:hypothetical protein
MLILKIIVEIVVALVLIALGTSFWSCVKSPRFMARTLADYDGLKTIFSFLDAEKIREETQNMEPVFGSYSNNIAMWLKSSISALDKTRNILLFFIVVIVAATYFLGTTFIIINIAIFLLLALAPIATSAQNNILSDVHTVLKNVYKWNAEDPVACKNFCTTEQPRILGNIYRLASELRSLY